jgi:hypothetical protein
MPFYCRFEIRIGPGGIDLAGVAGGTHSGLPGKPVAEADGVLEFHHLDPGCAQAGFRVREPALQVPGRHVAATIVTDLHSDSGPWRRRKIR